MGPEKERELMKAKRRKKAPQEHNQIRPLAQHQEGKLPADSGVGDYHDDWCRFWEGGLCDCKPRYPVDPDGPEVKVGGSS